MMFHFEEFKFYFLDHSLEFAKEVQRGKQRWRILQKRCNGIHGIQWKFVEKKIAVLCRSSLFVSCEYHQCSFILYLFWRNLNIESFCRTSLLQCVQNFINSTILAGGHFCFSWISNIKKLRMM